MSSIFICSIVIHNIRIITDNVLRNLNINGRTWMKVFIVRSFSPAFIFLVSSTFPRSMVQIVRRFKSRPVWNIFGIAFVFLGYDTFVVEKELFYYTFSYSIKYNSWNLNALAFIFCMVSVSIVSKVDITFQLSRSLFTL